MGGLQPHNVSPNLCIEYCVGLDALGDGRTALLSIGSQSTLWSWNDVDARFDASMTDQNADLPTSSDVNGPLVRADVNGDGLDDLVNKVVSAQTAPKFRLWLNTGRGFDRRQFAIVGADGTTFEDLERFIVGDFNGDGRADINMVEDRWHDLDDPTPITLLSMGNQFVVNKTNGFPQAAGTADFDGDGLDDLFGEETNDRLSIRLSARVPQNLLTSMEDPFGATTSITYTPSSAWDNERLPRVLQTVSRVEVDDGRGTVSATDYAYEGGDWDIAERRFLGFRKLTATLPKLPYEDSAPQVEVTFSQALAAVGVPTLVERFEVAANGSRTRLSQRRATLAVRNDVAPFRALVTRRESYLAMGSDLQGQKTDYEHDAFANVTSETQTAVPNTAGGRRTVTRTYHQNLGDYLVDRVAIISTHEGQASGPLKRRIRQHYDGQGTYQSPPTKGNLTRRRVEVLGTSTQLDTTYTYDAKGNLTSEETPLGHRTQYVYGTGTLDHLVVAKRLPPYFEGDTRWVERTDWGGHQCAGPASTTDVNGRQTVLTYDLLCREQEVNLASGERVQTSYNTIGDPTQQTIKVSRWAPSGSERFAEYHFDGLGRVHQIQSPLVGTQARMTDTRYDARGNVSRTTLPYYGNDRRWTDVEYDALDREVRRTFPDGATRTTSHVVPNADVAVLRTIVTDAAGIATETLTDAFERVVRTTIDPGGEKIEMAMTYDVLDQLASVADARNNTVVYTHDSAGRRTRTQDPNHGTWRFEHDRDGRMTRRTDALGQRTDYAYDSMDRLTRRTSLPGTAQQEVLTRTYDGTAPYGVGELAQEASQAGTYSYTYDVHGKVRESTFIIDGVTYTRTEIRDDPSGDTTRIVYPDGDQVGSNADRWTHNADGGVIRIPGLVNDTDYNARGQVTRRAYANGTVLEQGFDDDRGWLTAITVSRGVDTVFEKTFTRDPSGRITSTGGAGEDRWTYTTDTAGRLVSALHRPSGAVTSYTYDRVNNMTSRTGRGSYTYPPAGSAQPHAPTRVGNASLSYDANGNPLQVRDAPTLNRTLTWDGLGRLATVARGGLTTMTYGPDDARQQRRFAPSTGAVETTTFVADLEVSPTGVLTKHPIADAKRVEMASYGVHLDHDGSVRRVTAPSGAPVVEVAYQPYGEEGADRGGRRARRGDPRLPRRAPRRDDRPHLPQRTVLRPPHRTLHLPRSPRSHHTRRRRQPVRLRRKRSRQPHRSERHVERRGLALRPRRIHGRPRRKPLR